MMKVAAFTLTLVDLYQLLSYFVLPIEIEGGSCSFSVLPAPSMLNFRRYSFYGGLGKKFWSQDKITRAKP